MNFRQYLREDKTTTINSFINLSIRQKDILAHFFKNHPQFDSFIDWNNKYLSFKDIINIILPKQIKGLDLLQLGKDYLELRINNSNNNLEYKGYIPLNWESARILAGKDCKWCITSKIKDWWSSYITNQYIPAIIVP